ncbi:MAG: ATP-binding protein [Pseudonocardiales bacterium]
MNSTTNATLLLGPDSAIGREFGRVAAECRCVFFVGPPGVGKSLMIQQLALIAQQGGRAVHLVRWDVARRVFEAHPAATHYPEVDGVTHPAIRWAAGLWVRDAVLGWHLDHPESADLLIGEAPLVGNRFVELAQPREDRAEDLLHAEATEFFVPVPSVTVRRAIQRSREQELRQPRHEQERANATPRLLNELWQEVQRASEGHGLPGARPGVDYRPQTYAAVYGRLLHARHHTVLGIDELLPVEVSAQELGPVAGELIPSQQQAGQLLAEVDSCEPGELERAVLNWFRI